MSRLDFDLVGLMDNVLKTLHLTSRRSPLPDGLNKNQVKQARHTEQLEELKVAYLWQQGKTFVEKYSWEIQFVEHSISIKDDLQWEQKLILVFTQIVKALLRDISSADSATEALEFILERENLWTIPMLTSMREFFAANQPEGVQLLFMQECLYYCREERSISSTEQAALGSLLTSAYDPTRLNASLQAQEDARLKHLKKIMKVIRECSCLFDAINTTFDEFYGVRSFPRLKHIGRLKMYVKMLVNKVQVLGVVQEFNAFSISLPNFYTVICGFPREKDNLAVAGMLVTLIHELSNQLQRRRIHSVATFLNSYTPTPGTTERAVHRSLSLVPSDDKVFAAGLDSGFEIMSVKHVHQEPESGKKLEEVLFGSSLKVLFESGAEFLLDKDNWTSLSLPDFQERFKVVNTKGANAGRGKLKLDRSHDGSSITFPRIKCGISKRRFKPFIYGRKDSN